MRNLLSLSLIALAMLSISAPASAGDEPSLADSREEGWTTEGDKVSWPSTYLCKHA